MQLTQSIIDALQFAAEKHRHQRRKDRHLSPYVNHLIEVLHLLWHRGEVRDESVLVASLLHDTLEDTETSGRELEQHFGTLVRELVEAVSDDKALPKEARKQAQIVHAPHLPVGAKLVKLADKCANLSDLLFYPPADWPDSRRRAYVDWAEQVVAGLRDTNAPLEDHFDQLSAKLRKRLDPVEPLES
jgi:guanosine-3',5'-bis(diphosphate) 3'-pyrophosphohydrolase